MDHGRNGRGFFASRANLVLRVHIAVVGFYLVSEHWAHLVGVGPLLLLLGLCFGMHFFMHGGHGGLAEAREEDAPPPGRGREPGDHRH